MRKRKNTREKGSGEKKNEAKGVGPRVNKMNSEKRNDWNEASIGKIYCVAQK